MIEQITPAFLLLHHFGSRCGSAYRCNLLMTVFVDWGVSNRKWTLMQWVDLMVMGSGLEESWYSLSLLFAWTPSIAHTRAAVSVPVRCSTERVVLQSYLLSFPSSNRNVIFPRIFFQITSKVAYLEYPIQLIHSLCFTMGAIDAQSIHTDRFSYSKLSYSLILVLLRTVHVFLIIILCPVWLSPGASSLLIMAFGNWKSS